MTLRELVAVEVMKWPRLAGGWQTGENTARAFHDWNPDTNIADAWRVVEKMKLRGFRFAMEDFGSRYGVDFAIPPSIYWQINEQGTDVPQLICIAALRACGVSEDRIEQARRKE